MKILRMLMASLQAGNELMPFPVCNEVITAANPVPSTIHDDPVAPGSFLFSEETDESIVDGQKSKVKSQNSKGGHSHAADRTLNNLPRVNDELALEDGEQIRKDIPRWLVNDDLAAFTQVESSDSHRNELSVTSAHNSQLITHNPRFTNFPTLCTLTLNKFSQFIFSQFFILSEFFSTKKICAEKTLLQPIPLINRQTINQNCK